MKSTRFIFTGLLIFLCFSLNAQVFIGGNFSFKASGGSIDDGSTTTDKISSFSIDLLPKVGKFMSEEVAVGAALSISYGHVRMPGVNEVVSKSHTVGIVPFMRYYPLKINKFSIYGQANVGLLFTGSNTKSGGTTTDGPSTTSFYINVFPGLAYELNERLSLETSLNFLSFGYHNNTTKNGAVKDKTSTFNIGAGIDNIISVGSITIGAIYKF